MTSRSPKGRHPGLVALTGFQQLSSFFSELQAGPDLASHIKAFEFNNDEEEEDAEQEAVGAQETREALIAKERTQSHVDITYMWNRLPREASWNPSNGVIAIATMSSIDHKLSGLLLPVQPVH